MEMPLTALRNGETGIITSTAFTERQSMCKHKMRKACKIRFTPARFIKRLADLGLTPGTKLTMVKSAPFNGPLEVCIRGSRLALGRGMASRILVNVER